MQNTSQAWMSEWHKFKDRGGGRGHQLVRVDGAVGRIRYARPGERPCIRSGDLPCATWLQAHARDSARALRSLRTCAILPYCCSPMLYDTSFGRTSSHIWATAAAADLRI